MYTVKDLAHELNIQPYKIYYDMTKGILVAEKRATIGRPGKGFEYVISDEEKERYLHILKGRPVHTINTKTEPVPPCYFCGRMFVRLGEYVVQPVEENGVLTERPICRTGACGALRKRMNEITLLKAEIADLKLKNKRMGLELQKIQQQLMTLLKREGYE